MSNLDIVETPINLNSRGSRVSESPNLDVLTDIYDKNKNMVIWQREPDKKLLSNIQQRLTQHPRLSINRQIDVHTISTDIGEALSRYDFDSAIAEDIAELTEMFCCLFDLKRAGFRLTAIEQAMCPRFHVDRVPCRLVSTLFGLKGTQWLPDERVNRGKLGIGSEGLADAQSGLYLHQDCIQQLNISDVALLKGEAWIGNENRGLVHRSPPQVLGETRLLMTLDFVS